VAFGETQHLPAQRGQAAVEGIEIVDQIFDLVRVELHAFDQRGQVFAQLLVFFSRAAENPRRRPSREHAIHLNLFELLEQRGDFRKLFKRQRL
jgi:hypothetical protein